MAKNPRLKDITGQKFGALTVIRQAGNTPRGGAVWLCRCDCGTETKPSANNLRTGKVRSCGCVARAATSKRSRTHGLAHTRIWHTWQNMKRRCADPQNPHYGAKGISVCEDWLNFENFLSWARGSGYSDELTIERIDNAKGYCPDNCCWVARGAQAFNRTIVAVNADGVPWLHIARQNGISDAAYQTRIFDGWSHEQAATSPMFKRRVPHMRDRKGKFV